MEEFANVKIPKSDYVYRIKTACKDQVSFGPVLLLMLVKISVALPTCLKIRINAVNGMSF